jgi:DNA-directed RNA polymerase subunit RPC12/RpoP
MALCSYCGKEINTLLNVQSGTYAWQMDKDGEYETEGFEDDGGTNVWECPECGKEITKTEEEAIAFLKGAAP